ncbi:MAG TPA: anti-sigma factor [Solirubrobacteraceae bacterium]|nr:anti-sigma factor [Solirubrobacteraceae bacterium]
MSAETNTASGHTCGSDAAAYVLGALEPAELPAFLEHLEGCAVCRDEVDALQGVVHALPMAAPPYPAPGRLRRRIMRSVRQDQARTRGFRGPVWFFNWPAGQWVGVLGVAATAVLVVVALLGSTARPPTRVIQARVTSGTGSAQLDVTGRQGELIVRHLRPLPRGRVYEVWLKAAHRKPVPADVLFLVTRHGDADVPVPRSLRGISLMMVTAERAGGSPVPTGKPVIVAQLS